MGIRLEEMIATEKQNFDQINYSLNDPEKQKELLMQDEEEDFLDEGINRKNPLYLSSLIVYSLL